MVRLLPDVPGHGESASAGALHRRLGLSLRIALFPSEERGDDRPFPTYPYTHEYVRERGSQSARASAGIPLEAEARIKSESTSTCGIAEALHAE